MVITGSSDKSDDFDLFNHVCDVCCVDHGVVRQVCDVLILLMCVMLYVSCVILDVLITGSSDKSVMSLMCVMFDVVFVFDV